MLVDGGDRGKGDDVVAYLRSRNVSNLTVVVATHQDADHIAGLVDVLQTYAVGQFIDNGVTHTMQTYQNLRLQIDQRNISHRIVRGGESIGIDPSVAVVILAPPTPLITGSRSDRNANSVVILLDYNNTEILLTGDPEEETEQFLVIKAVDIDILKVGHHGSRYASSDMFLDAFKPEVGIISVGANNRYGHPHQEALNRLAARNITVYRTDLNGNIIATTDGISYATIPDRAS